jgi:hypothetical protein
MRWKTTFSHKIPVLDTIWRSETLSTSQSAITLGFIRGFWGFHGGRGGLFVKRPQVAGDI